MPTPWSLTGFKLTATVKARTSFFYRSPTDQRKGYQIQSHKYDVPTSLASLAAPAIFACCHRQQQSFEAEGIGEVTDLCSAEREGK
jgi:hypothetical protein